jgi:hemoglobin
VLPALNCVDISIKDRWGEIYESIDDSQLLRIIDTRFRSSTTISDMATNPDDQSIYDEIGGREAVDAVVSEFYDRILADEQVAHFFEGFDMAELHAHQVQFISSVAGGPVSYTGAEMREAHAQFDIGKADFDAVATHLDVALRENGVCDENVETIMTEVAALEDPILDR